MLLILQNLTLNGTASIVETHDATGAVGHVTSFGVSYIRDSSDVAAAVAKISSTGIIVVLETVDSSREFGSETATGFVSILEYHDRSAGVANVTAAGFVTVIERSDRPRSVVTVSAIGTVHAVEYAEPVGFDAVGAQAIVMAGGTVTRNPAGYYTLTIPVNTSAGGTVSQIVITTTCSNHGSAISAILSEIERALNIYTLANSTFN